MRCEFEAQRVLLWLVSIACGTSIFVLLNDLLQIPDTDRTILVARCKDMAFGEAESGHD